MSPGKVVAVVLVAIAMLFVVALALGSNRHDGTARPDGTGFFSHLQAGKFLQASGDVTVAGCSNSSPGIVIVSSATCTLDVPAGGALARPTRFALTTTLPVAVRVEPRRNGPGLDKALGTDQCLGGAFDGKGGTIRLGPALGTPVSITLRTERCP